MTDELPGGELPKTVYHSVAAAFALMFLASWIAFARSVETGFLLAVVVFLGIVAMGLPWLIFTTARHHVPAAPETLRHFLTSDIDTATGPLSGGEAWLQIVIIPAALALAAVLLGAVFVLTL